MQTTSSIPTCGYCGRPVLSHPFIPYNGAVFHVECCQPPTFGSGRFPSNVELAQFIGRLRNAQIDLATGATKAKVETTLLGIIKDMELVK